MKKLFPLFLAIALLSCNTPPPAELIVKGKIWTGNPQQPWAEAMAIKADTIVAVGSASDIKKYEGEKTQIISAPADGLITPGFIDTHTHFVEGGFSLASVHLRDAKSKEEFIQRIADFVKTQKPGVWIIGGEWDHTNWGGELPDRNWIDAVTPDNPVWLSRLDGHMSLANSAALKAANVTDAVKAVAGGEFVRDKKGRLTGVIKDNAKDLVDKAMPAPSAEAEDAALKLAMDYMASNGVTSAHSVYGFVDAFQRARASNKIITRVYAGMMLTRWKELKTKIDAEGRGDKWVKIGLLKAFTDGALGSHTAAMYKPFEDTPKDSGFFLTPPEELYTMAKSADSAGLHVTIHAIGDKAINTLLNIYERIENENGPKDRRFRIEHVQHIAPADIPRFAKQKVIASMQPYHAIDDGRWAEKVIGHERAKTTYAFKSMLDAQAPLAFGSDWPVAPATPLEGIYAAVTRRTLDDKNPDGWFPEQKISVEDALKAYTKVAAYASFDENIKGSLEPGKLADFVVLEKDITNIDPVKIRKVKVLKTVVGGRIVFEKR